MHIIIAKERAHFPVQTAILQLIHADNLIIALEKKIQNEEHQQKNHKYLRREFSYSKFQQAVTLPDDVEKEKISAKMSNEVQTIDSPKKEPAPVVDTSRMIDIQ